MELNSIQSKFTPKVTIKSFQDSYLIQEFIYEQKGFINQYFYKAWANKLNKMVSLRVIDINQVQGQNEKYIEREKLNVFKANTLKCKNIAEFYDIFQEMNYHFLIQEYLEKDLQSHICANSNKRLTEDEAISFIKQMVNAINSIHQIKIYHRGLSLQSFRLDIHGDLKLGDFLLSKNFDQENEITSSSNLFKSQGEPFVVPNMGSSIQDDAFKDDSFSLGVILFTMTMGLYYPFIFQGQTLEILQNNITQRDLSNAFKQQQINWDLIGLNKSIQRPILREDVQDLIKNMLIYDVKRRFSLQQILQHSALKEVEGKLNKNIGEESIKDLNLKQKHNYFQALDQEIKVQEIQIVGEIEEIENNLSAEQILRNRLKKKEEDKMLMILKEQRQFFEDQYFVRTNYYRSLAISVQTILKLQSIHKSSGQELKIQFDACRIWIDYLENNYKVILDDLKNKSNVFQYKNGNLENFYKQDVINYFKANIQNFYNNIILQQQQKINEYSKQEIPLDQVSNTLKQVYQQAEQLNSLNKIISYQDLYFILHSNKIILYPIKLEEKEFLHFFDDIENNLQQQQSYKRYLSQYIQQIKEIKNFLKY